VTPILGTPTSATLTNATGLPLTTGVTGQLPVANGGTGTATPSIVAGSNVTVTGTWPNQTIASSGSGGGVAYTAVKTANYTAANNDGVLTNTIGGAFTVTLPTSPSVGNIVLVIDSLSQWGTNNLTIDPTASIKIAGNTAGDTLVCDITGATVTLVYTGATYGWNVAAQVGANDTAVVTLNGTQTLTNKTLTSPTITSPTITGTGAIAAATVTLSSTLAVTGVSTLTGGAVVQGLTVGRGAGAVSTNTAVGAAALNNGSLSGGENVGLGYNSAQGLTTGVRNTILGSQSGQNLTTGSDNILIGYRTVYNATSTGSNNVAVGSQSLYSNTTASENTAVGYQAGYNFTTSNQNTVIGYAAGKGGATGQTSIVCVGAYAGAYQRTATGSGVILIGAQADVASSANTFEIVIGYNTQGKGTSTGFINPNSGGVYQGNNSSSWSTTSDQRLKKNIVDNTDGLSKISSIRVRNFEYRLPEEVTELDSSCAVANTGVQLGVIAQELQQVLPECVKTESTGVMSVDTDNLTWYMINAIKELKAEFDAYKLTHP
jgi:hypothetical protein